MSRLRYGPLRGHLLLAACIAITPLLPTQDAFAQYPARPLRLVVAYPPGGPVDIVARTLGQAMTGPLGQAVVVDNRAGANGIIGSEHVARAAPDGYTLLLTSTPLTIQESLYKKLPYSALRDFTYLAAAGSGPQMLVVHEAVPAQNLRELIALAKAQPGKLNFASPGAGGANHLAAEMLKTMAGIEATHVPYKGFAPAEADLLGGRISFMFSSLPAAMQHVRSGRLRAIGVTSTQRARSAPEVPTLAEAGLPGFDVSSWYGVVGPAGLAQEVVVKINAAVNSALESAAMKERLATLGVEAPASTPEQFAEFIRRDIGKWARVVKDSGATAD